MSTAAPPGGADLTIAISTLGARAGQIALPAPRPFLRWLVLVQRPDRAPPLPPRDDLRVVALDTLGLSASRNAALDRAGTPFLMIADDDVTHDWAGVETLLATLRADPRLALVTGRLAGRGRGRRGYRLRPWNIARTNSSEILMRLAPVRAAGLRFDEDFGLGARHGIGEEFIFLADALRAGLRARHVPVVVAHHPHASTGARWTDPAVLTARRAVFTRVYGRLAPLMRLAFALRHRRRLARAPGGVWGFIRGRRR